jgi:hypothetical protein
MAGTAVQARPTSSPPTLTTDTPTTIIAATRMRHEALTGDESFWGEGHAAARVTGHAPGARFGAARTAFVGPPLMVA